MDRPQNLQNAVKLDAAASILDAAALALSPSGKAAELHRDAAASRLMPRHPSIIQKLGSRLLRRCRGIQLDAAASKLLHQPGQKLPVRYAAASSLDAAASILQHNLGRRTVW